MRPDGKARVINPALSFQFVVSNDGAWQGLYLEGTLVVEGETIKASDLLEAIHATVLPMVYVEMGEDHYLPEVWPDPTGPPESWPNAD